MTVTVIDLPFWLGVVLTMAVYGPAFWFIHRADMGEPGCGWCGHD